MAEEKIENINPLKQKSPNIELTVDEKGLNELPQTIPTDVDYFLRKQQGEIESKELFELQQQYPEYMQNAFMEAKNEEHWYSIEKQVRDRLEIENELSKKGWVGFGARMVAAVVDPVAIGLTVATGGYAAPLLIGNKIQRIKRAIKFGALVGAENAVIESGLVALDPMKNEDDIRYAFYAGFALGAPVGGLSRVDPRIRKAEKQVKVAATRAINNLQAEEVKTFALDNKLNVNPEKIKD